MCLNRCVWRHTHTNTHLSHQETAQSHDPGNESDLLVFQMCQMQTELEEEWKERSRQALASAKEHHSAELAELAEHRDLLQEQLAELQQKVRTGPLLQPPPAEQRRHRLQQRRV